ncbi:MAG: sigma-54-dependent Fis family transcriptional regulator [Spirochaetaceae bacterium]|nr:sigma-54-dependent Fis family transcriptional regulator [Spirochaetaceae bacterium]
MKMPVVLLFSNSAEVLQFFLEDLKICGISRHFCMDSVDVDNLSRYDCCVFDVSDETLAGMSFLEKLKACKIETPVVLLVSLRIFESVRKMFCTQKLVTVLQFPVSSTVLKKCISQYVINDADGGSHGVPAEWKIENTSVCDDAKTTADFDALLGTSEAVVALKKKLACISQTDEPILIEGESGTGKTFIARLLHENSKRAKFPFISVNSAAIPDTIAESELMGSVNGAYTGAGNRPGYFEQADGGTLFLDEICEMSKVVQAKLLKLCESDILYRIGSVKPVKYDVRLICATNANISENVQQKLFRQDLYYRISVLKLKIPPLRERPEDIPLLIEHFLKAKPDYNKYYFSPDAVEKMLLHSWPGNIRELKNCVYRAVSLCDGDLVLPEHILFD